MWSKVEIKDAADIISGGTPSRYDHKLWGGSIPWVTPSDISKCSGRYLRSTKENITKIGLEKSSAKLLPKSTVLLTSRASVGEAKVSFDVCCTNQGFKSLVAKMGYNPEFLYYQVCENRPQFQRYAIGSTFPEINKPDVGRVKFSCPENIDEQDVIVKVLNCIDTQIEQTEALIAKQENIRQGLMQDLFTRGVDETGQSRPAYKDAPHLYYETELGWLPIGWNFESIDNCLLRAIDYRGVPPPKSISGIPLLTAKNVRLGWLAPNPAEFILEADFKRWMRRGMPNPGDVLFTTEAPLGNVAQIPDYQVALGQRTLTLQPDPSKITQDFLKWSLMSEAMRSRIFRLESGSTAKGIQSKTFKQVPITYPTVSEQKFITRALNESEKVTNDNLKNMKKLQKQKAGLMRDLLSGDVSVAPLMESSSA